MTENPVATEQPEMAQAAPEEAATDALATAEPSAPPAAAEPTPRRPREEEHGYQVWYMLNSLAIAPDHRVKWGDVKRKVLSKKAREQLHLSEENAKQVLDELQQAGHVRTMEKRGTQMYELTESGEQHLRSLPAHPAFAASAAAAAPVTDETLRHQHACLLLHLLEADNHELTKSDANARLGRFIQRDIGLNPAVANVRRLQLARQGYIEIDKSGRQETYRLTPDGRDYLAALEQFPGTEFRVRGATINALLQAAKESPGRDREAAAGEQPEPPMMEESPAMSGQEV